MLKHTVIAAAAAALLATGLAPVHAQGEPPAPKREMRVYGEEVMMPQERQAYIDKMRAAKTPEERAKLRDEHRAEMQKRAQDKDITLKEPQRGAKGTPKGGRQSKMGDLFTPEEQADFHRRMKEAKTPEERDKVRADMRAQADARAKEKGMAPKPAPAPDAPKAQ
jgi:hypothetical protein